MLSYYQSKWLFKKYKYICNNDFFYNFFKTIIEKLPENDRDIYWSIINDTREDCLKKYHICKSKYYRMRSNLIVLVAINDEGELEYVFKRLQETNRTL